jgi:hypothetical protein
LTGNLLVAQLIFGNLVSVDLSPDGRSVDSVNILQGGYDGPLDVTVGPNGVIYVAEFNADRIAWLAPEGKVGGVAEFAPPSAPGGRQPWSVFAVLGAASVALVVGLRALGRYAGRW